MKLLTFTGAGGAGATTLAAAAAVGTAIHGRRTLLLSHESPATLAALFALSGKGSAFRVPLGSGPEGLWCLAADEVRETAEAWQSWQPWMAETALSLGGQAPDPAMLAMLPGSRMLAMLLALRNQAAHATFETIVLDAGPAEPLARWLLLLDAAARLDLAAGEGESLVMRIGRPLLRRITGVPLPDEASRQELVRLAVRLIEGASALTAENAICYAVAPPGRLPALTLRPALALLALSGVRLGGVVCRQRQGSSGARESGEAFAPLPIRAVPEVDAEPLGLDRLCLLGEAVAGRELLPGPDEPAGARIVRRGEVLEYRLPLPFVAPAGLQLLQDGERLTVIIPGGRRTLVLPDLLIGRMCAGARIDSGVLCLSFPPGGPV